MLQTSLFLPRARAEVFPFFAEAANPDVTSKPKFLAKRGGGGYSDITFSVLKAILGDSGQEIVASVRNQGAVSDLPADAAVVKAFITANA